MANIDIKLAIALTFPIGAIIGYFIRLFVEDKIIRKRDRDNRYAEAYNAFAKVFTPALRLLEDPSNITYHIILNELPMHEDAMFDFVHIIRDTKRENPFRKKWSEYKDKCERIKKYSMSTALDGDFPDLFELDKKTVKDFNEELKQLIIDLLKIAKKF